MSQDRIWEYFQNQGVESFDDAAARYAYLVQRICRMTPAGARVLNIGVGSGALERTLLDLGYEVSALDPSQSAIARLRESGVDARVGYVEQLPFDKEAFEIVIASEVLEHLNPALGESAVRQIRRVLVSNGHFIGTVPFNERLSDNRAVCPNCGHLFHRWGHERSFSRQDLTALLSTAFESVEVSTRSFVSWKGGLRRRSKSVIRWLLGRIGEPIASPHLYFECRMVQR